MSLRSSSPAVRRQNDGFALIIDNTVIDTKTQDLWWGGAGNYGNTSQLLAGTIDLSAGVHTLKAYGFEACCDGGTGTSFRCFTKKEAMSSA